MDHPSLDAFLDQCRASPMPGPVAVIFAEDPAEVGSTLRHNLAAGFATLLLLGVEIDDVPEALLPRIHRIRYDIHADDAVPRAVNRLIAAAPGQWFYYCYNAEYLFYPFSESRSVRELLAFHAEERRDAMLCYVVDLYAGDLGRFPNAVSLEAALLDRTGYYAQSRPDPANHNHPKERQLDFFGGLRWRFEEHVPPDRRRIDRIGLFRARPGLELLPGHRFNVEEYNTYACPWHNNLTAAICSFRTAKALKRNPGSTHAIADFRWRGSTAFEWRAQQLMDLGLMEPGQWF